MGQSDFAKRDSRTKNHENQTVSVHDYFSRFYSCALLRIQSLPDFVALTERADPTLKV